jgi:hypothetical protein
MVELLVALKFVSFVHGDVLIYKFIDLLVHIVRKLSPDASSVAEQNENQQNKKSDHTENNPQNNVRRSGLKWLLLHAFGGHCCETVANQFMNFIRLKIASISDIVDNNRRVIHDLGIKTIVITFLQNIVGISLKTVIDQLNN